MNTINQGEQALGIGTQGHGSVYNAVASQFKPSQPAPQPQRQTAPIKPISLGSTPMFSGPSYTRPTSLNMPYQPPTPKQQVGINDFWSSAGDMARTFPRAAVQIGHDLTGTQSYTAQTPTEKFLLGNQPVQNTTARYQGNKSFLAQHGVTGIGGALLAGGITGAATLGDLLPWIPESKGASILSDIAKTSDTAKIFDTLTSKLGMTEQVAKDLAPKLTDVNKASDVKSIIADTVKSNPEAIVKQPLSSPPLSNEAKPISFRDKVNKLVELGYNKNDIMKRSGSIDELYNKEFTNTGSIKNIKYQNKWTKDNSYGDTLYHETSPRDALTISSVRDTPSPAIRVANSEDLAQGQGGKGIKIMFDPNKAHTHQVSPEMQKPSAGFLHSQGLTDELNLSPNKAEQGWIKGVIVKKGTPDINQPGGLEPN